MAVEFRALVALHSGFINKPEDFQAANRAGQWRNAELSPLELVDWIGQGHAWLACQLSRPERVEDAAASSNLIVLDIDGDFTLDAFWSNPLVARHCLFTATSWSHKRITAKNKEALERFRAVFRCQSHDDIPFHRALYGAWVKRLGLSLADNCGAKPERLWYGNTDLEVRFGEGEPIPWDLEEAARDALIAEQQALSTAAPINEEITDLDLKRCDYALRHLLPTSAHGGGKLGYDDYWQRLLNAAASAGDVLYDAFQDWSHRGDHGKEERMSSRRWRTAGRKSNPLTILAIAKDHLGEGWWRQLPESLWYGGGGALVPRSLMSSRSAADISPAGGSSSFSASSATTVPDRVPSAEALQQLAAAAPKALFSAPAAAAATAAAEASISAQIEQMLVQLYCVETERVLYTEEGERKLTPRQARYKADELESELQNFPVFRTNPQRIRTRLLQIFAECNGLTERSDYEREPERFLDEGDDENTYLIDGLLVSGASYLLYSLAGVGKTTLALLLVRAALGTPGHTNFLGFKATPSEPFSHSRVLYIASDGGLFAKGDGRRYIKAMQQENAEWLRYVEVLNANRKNNANPWTFNLVGLYQLVKLLDQYAAAGTPVRMLVIDSLKACMPENMLIGDQAVARYLDVIENICAPRNVTVIYLHHQAKESDQPQGIAALTEKVHGYFRIKMEENQRSFCINKLRDGSGARREIPYKVTAQGDLLISDVAPLQDSQSPLEAALLSIFSAHYSKHLKLTDHLAEDDEYRTYRGLQRSDLPLLLRQQQNSDPSWRNARNLDRTLAALVKDGSVQRLEKGRYAIAHAEHMDPAEQKHLQLPADDDLDLPGW